MLLYHFVKDDEYFNSHDEDFCSLRCEKNIGQDQTEILLFAWYT